jgi:hypothetical protein
MKSHVGRWMCSLKIIVTPNHSSDLEVGTINSRLIFKSTILILRELKFVNNFELRTREK